MEANEQIALSAQKEKKADKEQFASVLKDPHPLYIGRYFIVEKTWYELWRDIMNDSKCTKEIPKFNNKVLLCPHGKMTYNPSEYVRKNSQKSCSFAAIPEDQWKDFKTKYAHPESPSIELLLSKTDEPSFSCDVCWECLVKEQEKAHEERCTFSSGKVTIVRLPGRFSSPEEVLEYIKNEEESKEAEKNESVKKGTKSRPARSATATKSTSRTIEGVDSSWDIQGFKMHVFANYDGYLDCGMPEQHVLIFNGEIMDDDKHLSDYKV